MANKNLTAAKAAKNDEFYTRLEDINEELQHYREHFADKIVYLNCDDGEWSNFWRFFYANFGFFKLKRLIATSYHKDGGSYKYEYEGGYDQSDYVANNYMEGVVKTMLTGDGDFRSDECIEILKQSDIVVTNPPFSLFREYIAQLMEYEKKFLIVGPMAAIGYIEVFPLIKNNKMWHGFNYVKEFMQPNGELKTFGNILWYTNLEHNKRHHIEEYYTEYSENNYSKYENYNAIEVSKLKYLPCNYTGVMGVPVTFLDVFCPEQFEILWKSGDIDWCESDECDFFTPPSEEMIKEYKRQNKTWRVQNPYIVENGAAKTIYTRIFIRWKPEAMPTINDGVILYESRN